jgi:hypothetical protein
MGLEIKPDTFSLSNVRFTRKSGHSADNVVNVR